MRNRSCWRKEARDRRAPPRRSVENRTFFYLPSHAASAETVAARRDEIRMLTSRLWRLVPRRRRGKMEATRSREKTWQLVGRDYLGVIPGDEPNILTPSPIDWYSSVRTRAWCSCVLPPRKNRIGAESSQEVI